MNTRMNGMASEAAHQFIVIEGPIGVGKTSLARRLCASLSAQGVLEEGAQVTETGRAPSLGHVTSSYRSPTLGRGFALALVAGGRARIGSTPRLQPI